MAMELEIEEEPEAEEEEEKEGKEVGGTVAAGGVELDISLESPEIHIEKLTIKKKE